MRTEEVTVKMSARLQSGTLVLEYDNIDGALREIPNLFKQHPEYTHLKLEWVLNDKGKKR